MILCHEHNSTYYWGVASLMPVSIYFLRFFFVMASINTEIPMCSPLPLLIHVYDLVLPLTYSTTPNRHLAQPWQSPLLSCFAWSCMLNSSWVWHCLLCSWRLVTICIRQSYNCIIFSPFKLRSWMWARRILHMFSISTNLST